MCCDICISSIDRKHQSGRRSDHKLTLCHSNATETALLTAPLCLLHKHVFFDRQSTKTIVVSLHILLRLFLDNLARWYRREKNVRHTRMACENLSCYEENKSGFIEPFSVSPCLRRGPEHFREACCRFLLRGKVISSTGK